MSARLATAILAIWLAMLVGSAASHAAFPGPNGQIVYASAGLRTISPDGTGDREIVPGTGFKAEWSPDGRRIAYQSQGSIYVAEADGSAATAVIGGFEPAWSPDGERIAFTRVVEPIQGISNLYVADADGGDVQEILGLSGSIKDPAWSPDGERIAFSAGVSPSEASIYNIWLVNPDGTDPVQLTFDNSTREKTPNWSPDGTRIAFEIEHRFSGASSLWAMDRDGANPTLLSSCCAGPADPAYSPDGTKIAFTNEIAQAEDEVWIMDADGTDAASLVVAGLGQPNWQPNLWPGHARPKGATPVRVSLVPTSHACVASNETHGPPLAFPSCNPPLQQSTTLTVGTTDANGFVANSQSFAKLTTVVGNPSTPADEADVALAADVTDVRCRATNTACPGGAGSDYAGSLLLLVSLRITDKLSGASGNESATLSGQYFLRAPFPCLETVDPGTGSDCALATAADAVVPGIVTEGKRAVWQLGPVEVYDSGPNGTGYASCPPTCGNGDETMFMRQGVFIP